MIIYLFFFWSNECSQIEFVAENIRVLISGEEIAEHNFKFFNEDYNYHYAKISISKFF